MKKRKNLSTVPWTPFEHATAETPKGDAVAAAVRKAIGQPHAIWINSRYQVIQYPPQVHPPFGRVIWLSLRAIDRSARHDWREMQRLKNEIIGPQYDAVEIYPDEAKLVDNANQYHLWVLLDLKLPFGFHHRVLSDGKFGNSVQRAFEERPVDCMDPDAYQTSLQQHLKTIGNL